MSKKTRFKKVGKNYAMKRLTKIVQGYLKKGWWIHGDTMRGTHGELCRVDVTNGKRLVRILLEDKHYWLTSIHEKIEYVIWITLGEPKDNEWKKYNVIKKIYNEDLIILKRQIIYQTKRGTFFAGPVKVGPPKDKKLKK